MIELGHIHELVRYPVKSMAGTPTQSAFLGWHGIAGDRRFAFRRLEDNSGFPWLSASRIPQLLLYQPFGIDESTDEPLPTHVRTPAGKNLELRSGELESEIAALLGSGVQLMKLRNGIFDDATISVISLATIAGIATEAGRDLDRRRFRANILLDTRDHRLFLEDDWIGGTLLFGESDPRPAVSVTTHDQRCKMINLDPDTGAQDARVLKTAVRLNNNNAGVYGTVVQTGLIRVGDPVRLLS